MPLRPTVAPALLALCLAACGPLDGEPLCGVDDGLSPSCASLPLFFVGWDYYNDTLDREIPRHEVERLRGFVDGVERALLRAHAVSRLCLFDERDPLPLVVFREPPADGGLALHRMPGLKPLEAEDREFSYVDLRGELVRLDSGELAVDVFGACGSRFQERDYLGQRFAQEIRSDRHRIVVPTRDGLRVHRVRRGRPVPLDF